VCGRVRGSVVVCAALGAAGRVGATARAVRVRATSAPRPSRARRGFDSLLCSRGTGTRFLTHSSRSRVAHKLSPRTRGENAGKRSSFAREEEKASFEGAQRE